MPSFASSLAAQIGFLIESLTKSNFNSVLYELSLLSEYGSVSNLIMLQTCLKQVNLQEGEVQNLQLKIDLLAIIIRHLIHQPNFSSIFCEAVLHVPFNESLLEDLSETLKLSLLEQIGLGLALTDAEIVQWQQQGYRFCHIKVAELCQTSSAVVSETIIDQLLLFLHESEGLSKHIPAFAKSLPPGAHTSLLLMPLLQDDVNDYGCLRRFDAVARSSCPISLDLMEQLDNAVEASDVMEELGYNCTIGVTQCKEFLSLFPVLNEHCIARIIAMVARTHTGLDDGHGSFATFFGAFGCSAPIDGLWAWNIETLVDCISEAVPDWGLVVDNFDHEGFYLPDQKAFNLLMAIYGIACKDPFPIEKICNGLWKNSEGQISFLRYAVLASPDIMQFKRLYSGQFPLENILGNEMLSSSTHQAWLSIPLLEVLCQLAEMGHAGAVRSMLEHPMKHCPDILLVGVIQIKTTWNLIQLEILASLFPVYLGSGVNSTTLFHQLWRLNSVMVIRGFLEVHSKDPTSIPRILDVCQELQLLPQILEAAPFSFSIDLAVSASRHDDLNLEKWLLDNLNDHGVSFFQACLKYLRERAAGEARTEVLGGSGHRSSLSTSLSLETTAIFFKALQSTPNHLISRELLEEMKRIHSAVVRVYPRLLSVGASDQSASENFPSDIEQEANSYFRSIYAGELPIEKVVSMLEQFKESRVKRDQEVFACMIQSLFDEYRFFPKYPERELRITAILFGSLIKHQLVSSLTLGIALRYVLDALRKPVDSRMFSFGLAALNKFRDRLVEWPQYCNHILQISHMREVYGGLVEFIERALARLSAEPSASHTLSSAEIQTSSAQILSAVSTASTADSTEVSEAFPSSSDLQQQQQTVQIQVPPSNSHDEKIKSSSLTALSFSKPFVSASNLQLQHSASTNQLFEGGNTQKGTLPSQPGTFQVAPTPGFPRPTPTKGTGFGHALNIGTLVAAAERRDTPIEAPSSEVQDKIAFIINNISSANLDTKTKEFTEVLKEQYYPWFAQYMVMKRASIEPNFHDTYLKFLDKISSRVLHKEVVKATYENCKVLLRSDLIKSSSEERSLLKNLGSWLGKLTIGRNQALRAIEIDPKVLITEAYERGLMIAVIPFTSKILEPCQSSLAYQPPNPWTMGILALLAEIYNLPNLKMNLKFDIEVLFKNLGVDMKDVKVSQLLKGRTREIEGNPDFSNKDAAIAHTPTLYTSETSSSSAVPAHVDLPSEASVSASHPVVPPPVSQPQLGSSHVPASLALPEEEKLATLALAERLPSGQGLPQAAGSPAPYTANQLAMPLPNLSSYVVMNPKLAALGQQLQLSRIVPTAMERAIREIISPVVERSVTIACMTTRELVTKDYAMESDDNRIRHSGNLMVASLAGSLAHVTCKEPLRAAMANHLRNLFQALNVTGDVLDTAVLLITNDNLDLGCAVIEKSATEKALRDLEDVIGPPLAHRRKQREAMGVSLYDVSFYSQGHLARLPECLRPQPGRLSNAQQRVYEDFARLPWQNQPSQSPAAAAAGSTVSSSIPSGSSLARAGYPQPTQGIGSYVGMAGVQPTMGLGIASQNSESNAEEIDLRLPLPLSHSSSGPMLVPDTGAHQPLDGAPGPGSHTSSALFMDLSSSDRQPALKDTSAVLTTSVSPPLPVEQVNLPPAESSWSLGDALEKFQLIIQKLDVVISKGVSIGLSSPSQDQDIQSLIMEVPEVISQCISKDEAALACAPKAFKRLYENATSALHVATYLAVLACIRDVCKRVVKEITSWVMYLDEERRYNREILVGLIRSELIHLSDYNVYLAKLIEGGRNSMATEFAINLVQTLVQENLASGVEFFNVIEALGKVAPRPGASESLQKLLEFVKNVSLTHAGQSGAVGGKEDKTRLSKEKRPSSRGGGSALREESKAIGKDTASTDPAGLQEQVAMLFEEWLTIWDTSGSQNNDKTFAVYISKLQHSGMLKGDDMTDRFFRILTELAVARCLNTETQLPGASGIAFPQQGLSFAAIDAYAKLVVLLVKYYGVDPSMAKINLLNKVLSVTVRVIQKVADEKKSNFFPRPYFRLFVMWLMEFNAPDPQLEASNFQVLTAFANAFMQLHPLRVPGWSFSWLELISHRMFMPKLMLSNSQKGWPLIQRLLVALFKFMEPYLRNADLSDPVRTLYRGTLRVLLVLLHDFPEFLSDNHFSFCDVIPPSCIQLRNLILSAFPRNMRLPDPFTPNLKVDLLPEIGQSPRILSDVEFALKNKQLKSEIDEYLKSRPPLSLLLGDLKQRLMLPQQEVQSAGTRYNVPLINALVLYVGMQAIQQLQSKTAPQQLAVPTAPITHSAPMDIYQKLIVELDTEGRYLFLNAVANQLRYPNNHTHYFSCVLLYLFAEANQEIIQEQITRVLLERLIVNRPHPWGLLITFIELIKNPRYNFWSHGFTRCAPEIEKLFESVARSCVGPPLKAVDDDIGSTIAAEGLKA